MLSHLNDHMAALVQRGEPDLKSRITEALGLAACAPAEQISNCLFHRGSATMRAPCQSSISAASAFARLPARRPARSSHRIQQRHRSIHRGRRYSAIFRHIVQPCWIRREQTLIHRWLLKKRPQRIAGHRGRRQRVGNPRRLGPPSLIATRETVLGLMRQVTIASVKETAKRRPSSERSLLWVDYLR